MREGGFQMRDPERIEHVLKLVSQYWIKHPDLRLGQILSNMHDDYRTSRGLGERDVFYFEDADLIETLEKQLQLEENFCGDIK